MDAHLQDPRPGFAMNWAISCARAGNGPGACRRAAGRPAAHAGARREEVAQLAGIGVDGISAWSRAGHVSPSITTVDALARPYV